MMSIIHSFIATFDFIPNYHYYVVGFFVFACHVLVLGNYGYVVDLLPYNFDCSRAQSDTFVSCCIFYAEVYGHIGSCVNYGILILNLIGV
jgi:hypothetical protein